MLDDLDGVAMVVSPCLCFSLYSRSNDKLKKKSAIKTIPPSKI